MRCRSLLVGGRADPPTHYLNFCQRSIKQSLASSLVWCTQGIGPSLAPWLSYVTPAFSGVPNAKRMEKIRIGFFNPAFLGAQKRAEVLRNPCILEGRPSKGDEIRIGWLTHAFLGAQKRAELLRNLCILGAPQCQARGDTLYGLPHPCLLGLMRGFHTLPSAFLGAQKRAELLCNPAFSGVANQKWTKSEVATSRLPSWGPKRGRKCYGTPAFSGIPQSKGDEIRIGSFNPAFLGAQKRAELVRNPCILGGPQRQAHGENQNGLPQPCLLGVATSPLPSWGPKRGRKCYVTPALLGAPNAKRGEILCMPHPSLLGGPKEGKIAM